MKRIDRARTGLQTGLDALFPILYGLFVFYRTSKVTTMSLPWPKGVEDALLIALAVAALLRVVALGLKRADVWIALALAGICRLVYGVTGYSTLNPLAVAAVGFVGMDYRRALRAHLIAAGGVFAVAVAAALTGSIRNIVYVRDGLRSSWGICYPTDFSTYVLFGAVALWVAWEKLPDWAMLPLAALPVILSLFVTQSRNSLICGALFVAMIGYRIIERGAPGKVRAAGWVRRGVDGLLVAAFPLCAAAMILLVALYARGVPLAGRLNDVLSDRLRLSVSAVEAHGVRLLGAKFAMHGNGFSDFPPAEYTFIDSTYVLLPVRYGWLLALALGALWIWLTVRAVRAGHRRLALALGLVAIHSMVEHHFVEVHCNAFLALLFAALPDAPAHAETEKRAGPQRLRAVASAITLALLAGALALLLPRALTRLRTAFGALGWVGGGVDSLPALLALALCLAVAAAGARVLYRLIFAAISRRRVPRRVLALALACALATGGGYVWSDHVVSEALRDNAALMNGERKAMKAVIKAATGGVYADVLPDVYHSRFGGIRATALAGSDLARHDGATALMRADREYNPFFQKGWRYAQISDAHSLYTDDPAVVAALEAAGYATTPYYSTPVEVDLAQAASQNRLEYNKYGLLLKGTKRPLKKGPRDDLYAGIYAARYSLRLPAKIARQIDETGADALVCTLRVAAYKGQTLIAEVPVYRSQFDEKRRLTVEIPFVAGNLRDVEFLAYPEADMRLYVTQLSYRKTG